MLGYFRIPESYHVVRLFRKSSIITESISALNVCFILYILFLEKPTTKFRESFRPMRPDCISNSYSMVCLSVRGDNP